MRRILPVVAVIGLALAARADAQATRGTARPAAAARPAAGRPATAAKATTRTTATTTKATTKAGAKAGAKAATGPAVTPNPTPAVQTVIIPARSRRLITTPPTNETAAAPATPEAARLAEQRKRAATGPLIVTGPAVGVPLGSVDCAPLRPASANRPWAGRYSWYNGGWSGWSSWPANWGGEEAAAPLGADYANPYQPAAQAQPAGPPRSLVGSKRATLGLSPGLQAALDYTKPIRPAERGTKARTVEAAQDHLDTARYAFRRAGYRDSLAHAERGIEVLPGDANLHEFRALTLFALKDYKAAAATLHPVLAADPGWNWDTMSSFYPKKETYTRQLRDLEEYVEGDPEDAAGRFLLGYHYLVLDDRPAALAQFREAAALEPTDAVAKALAEALGKDVKERGAKRK